MLPWHQYILGFLFLFAGANHFRMPKIYEKITPPYLPNPKMLVMVSGIAEMCFGLILMNPETQKIGAWGILILLILFIPVHIYMLQEKKASLKLPRWVLFMRIPLQFLLMYWAYLYV